MDIRVFDNMDDLTQSFTDWLAERLTEKEYLTISLSGGDRKSVV